MAIAVRDVETGLFYHTIRSSQDGVAVYEGMKSTGVGTQLHAYDSDHLQEDGLPHIFNAVRKEVFNEACIRVSQIQSLVVSGWGVGLRTGIPELLFICDPALSLPQILDKVKSGKAEHGDEFDEIRMSRFAKESVIKFDYQLIADLKSSPSEWEPESAVACCLAIAKLAPDAITLG